MQIISLRFNTSSPVRSGWLKNQLVYTMQAARWRRVLGRSDPVMIPL